MFKEKYTSVNNSRFIEWLCRILITANLVLAGLQTDEHWYPADVVALTIIALWAYFLKGKLLSLVPLLMGLFIHYIHYFLG